MARILEFCDGAERGDTSWWTNNGGVIDTTKVIHGTYCYGWGTSDSSYKSIVVPMSEFYFRCYIYYSVGGGPSINVRAGSTILLALTQDSILSRLNITGGATGNTGNNSTHVNTWQCVELYYKIHDSLGVVTVRIDGVEVFTFSGDTKPGADTTADNFLIANSGGGSPAFYADDFALDNSAWCGLSYYVGLTVNADGTLNEWTPSAGSNYQNVAIPANDSTYNSTNLAKTDEYNLTTVDITGKSVLRVIPFGRVQNPLGGSVNLGVLTHALPYTAVVATPTSFAWKFGDEYELNPNTGNPWNQGEIDALQIHIDTL